MIKMAFDTETSGLDFKKHAVLTAYFAILDENDQVVDELDLKTMPDDGNIEYEQSALDVNGIDLEKHKKEALTYSQARPLIVAFFKKYSPGKKRNIQPCGHNIDFDINMLTNTILDLDTWETMIHYRRLDTSPLTSFLKETEILPEKIGSLTSLVDHFGLQKRLAHNAKEDTLMWVDVFKAMKKMLNDMKKGSLTSSSGFDILLTE